MPKTPPDASRDRADGGSPVPAADGQRGPRRTEDVPRSAADPTGPDAPPARDHRAVEPTDDRRQRRRRREPTGPGHEAAVPAADDRLHKVKDLTQRSGLSVRHLRRDIAAGELVAHRFGRAIRVSERDFQDYLRRHREKGR